MDEHVLKAQLEVLRTELEIKYTSPSFHLCGEVPPLLFPIPFHSANPVMSFHSAIELQHGYGGNFPQSRLFSFFFHLRKREAELARLHAQRGRPEPSRARPLSPPPARPASYRPPPGDYYSQPPPPKRPRVEQPRTPYSYSAQTPQRTSPMEEMLLFYAFVWYKH